MINAVGTDGLLRELAPQVLGAVVRRYGDFAGADDAVQEALVTAATAWPVDGEPDNPRAWLIRVASRRMVEQYCEVTWVNEPRPPERTEEVRQMLAEGEPEAERS